MIMALNGIQLENEEEMNIKYTCHCQIVFLRF